jgi:hypothetical protein
MEINRTLRIGYWLSLLGGFLGLVYFGLVIASLGSGTLLPTGLIATLLHVGVLLTAAVMVLLWAIIHHVTPAEKQAFSLGSLVFIAIFATLTSINRYNALTVVPQAAAMGGREGLDWFQPYGWPSIMFAMEVLAWGGYFGLACLCLAPAFGRKGLEKAIFWTLIACGGLSLFAILSQVLNNPPLFLPAVLAWGPGLILLTVLWARWFKVREENR